MSEVKEIKLQSGAILKISHPPFAEAKELFQAILEESRTMKIDESQNIDVNLFKDIFCLGFSSVKIEKALAKCLRRCLYNDLKIDDSTFEAVEARQDYLAVVFEVVSEVIMPFMKTLTQLLPQALAKLQNIQA